ncbi:MAG: RDD family protein [Methylococcus sp.]|nr:MAG: RDD family protein [Methylococcus sp.]
MSVSASREAAESEPVAGFRYAGFWIRVWASLIDLVLFSLWTIPLMYLVYGPALWTNQQLIMGPADVLINWVLPSIAVIVLWKKRQATMGKMAIRARIVDARTGQAPTTRQDLIRYFGYLLSVMPLGLGYLWVAFDPRKQGFHDKLAGTVVVRDART